MEEILSVAGLFLLRVGLPIVLLVILGVVVDRWQNKREERMQQHYAPSQEKVIAGFDDQQQAAGEEAEAQDVRTGTHG